MRRRTGCSLWLVTAFLLGDYLLSSRGQIENACVANTDQCYAIINESNLSINSQVYPNFFIGRRFLHPIIKLDYIEFDDGEELCVDLDKDGRFLIYSRYQPLNDTLGDRVHLVIGKAGLEQCSHRKANAS